VEGYARRFWQGNETHRGEPGRPGRVATLVEEAGTLTHGLALELKGEDALEYLNNRKGGRHRTVIFKTTVHKALIPILTRQPYL
jgi:cation transport regulator ChaC